MPSEGDRVKGLKLCGVEAPALSRERRTKVAAELRDADLKNDRIPYTTGDNIRRGGAVHPAITKIEKGIHLLSSKSGKGIETAKAGRIVHEEDFFLKEWSG